MASFEPYLDEDVIFFSGLGALEAPTRWVCKKCTRVNSVQNTVCIACDRSKSKRISAASGAIPKGQTIHGVVQGKLTDITNRRRTHSSVKAWFCPMCAYENSSASVVCSICTSPRDLANNSKRLNDISFATADETFTDFSRHESKLIEVLRENGIIEARNKLKGIIKHCKKNTRPFVDNSFPASPRSLYYNPNGNGRKTKVVQWLRPHEIKVKCDDGTPWAVFRNPLPSDICQGALGDCWLLSALAVLAEREDLIKKIFDTGEICQQGAYLVRLCKDGKRITVLVDDLLPCDKHGHLVYSQAKRKQLWVPLIEKAAAKIYGCYEALDGGYTAGAFAMLTGAPCEIILLQREGKLNKDLIWAQLLSTQCLDFLVGASCGNEKLGKEQHESKQLVMWHAYSMLDVKDIHGHRLLKLRNPWGRYSWRGDWSDNSQLWSDELRRALMPHGAVDGEYWISFEDTLKYFDGIDVCKVRCGWNEVRLQATFQPFRPLSCVVLVVLEKTEADFMLFQDGQRKFEESQRSLLDLGMAIFRARDLNNPEIGQLVEHSKPHTDEFVGCNKVLERDLYLVVSFAFNRWHTGADDPSFCPQCVLAIHSSKQFTAEQINPPSFLLADAIISLILTKGKRHESRVCGVVYYNLTNVGWSEQVIMVENQNKTKWIQVECDYRKSKNVVSTRGELKTIDSVPPLQRQVISVLTRLDPIRKCDAVGSTRSRSTGSQCLHDWGLPGETHYPAIDSVQELHAPRPIKR